jgi:hypothetical protein
MSKESIKSFLKKHRKTIIASGVIIGSGVLVAIGINKRSFSKTSTMPDGVDSVSEFFRRVNECGKRCDSYVPVTIEELIGYKNNESDNIIRCGDGALMEIKTAILFGDRIQEET